MQVYQSSAAFLYRKCDTFAFSFINSNVCIQLLKITISVVCCSHIYFIIMEGVKLLKLICEYDTDNETVKTDKLAFKTLE